MRFIVLILLVVLAVWLIRRAVRRLGQGSGRRETAAGEPPVQGDLVRCAHCGVHLPRAEARMAEGILYCSDEHARLGRPS
jgi:uncharacterized protein